MGRPKRTKKPDRSQWTPGRVRPAWRDWIREMSSTLGDGSVIAMLERLAREEAIRKGYREGPER